MDRYQVESYPGSEGKWQEVSGRPLQPLLPGPEIGSSSLGLREQCRFYVSWLESSTVLTDVKPDTECRVDVSSVVEDEHSEALKGTEKTLPVVSLNLYDVGSATRQVQWQPVGGAAGYTLFSGTHQRHRTNQTQRACPSAGACGADSEWRAGEGALSQHWRCGHGPGRPV